MSARDDLYAVAALLADIDRVLSPLPPDEDDDIGTTPPIPPPLPPAAPRGGARVSAASAPAGPGRRALAGPLASPEAARARAATAPRAIPPPETARGAVRGGDARADGPAKRSPPARESAARPGVAAPADRSGGGAPARPRRAPSRPDPVAVARPRPRSRGVVEAPGRRRSPARPVDAAAERGAVIWPPGIPHPPETPRWRREAAPPPPTPRLRADAPVPPGFAPAPRRRRPAPVTRAAATGAATAFAARPERRGHPAARVPPLAPGDRAPAPAPRHAMPPAPRSAARRADDRAATPRIRRGAAHPPLPRRPHSIAGPPVAPPPLPRRPASPPPAPPIDPAPPADTDWLRLEDRLDHAIDLDPLDPLDDAADRAAPAPTARLWLRGGRLLVATTGADRLHLDGRIGARWGRLRGRRL